MAQFSHKIQKSSSTLLVALVFFVLPSFPSSYRDLVDEVEALPL